MMIRADSSAGMYRAARASAPGAAADHLETMLGSCVGVRSGARGWAWARCAIGVLPRCPAGVSCDRTGYRYVDFAIRHLARQFDALGRGARRSQVKLFGGADVLPVDRSRAPAHGGQH